MAHERLHSISIIMKISKSILVVDDHPIVLAGLRTLISQDGLYTKIQCASDLPSAREIINQENIDTAIIDLELSNDNGLALIKLLHQKHPKTKIVVYTMHQEIWTIRQLMNEDADAIVLKNENPQELLTALHKIEDGKGYYSQQFVRLINLQNTRQVNLSSRELEVLEYISDGHSTNTIAQELNISANTVEFHRHNLMSKLHVNNVAQMVKKAMQMGLEFIMG